MFFFATVRVMVRSRTMLLLLPVTLERSIWLYSSRKRSRLSPFMGSRMEFSNSARFTCRLRMVIFAEAPESRALRSSE